MGCRSLGRFAGLAALAGCQTMEQVEEDRSERIRAFQGRTMADFSGETGLTPSSFYPITGGRVFVVDGPPVNSSYGGYSNVIVVPEDFVLKVPESLPIEAAAPILCAGVTVYSPMKHWGVKAGDKVGVLGLGGLGHMAVKIAKALGAEVTVFTSNPDKIKEAKTIGADAAVIETDKTALAELTASFDFILSTVPDKHEVTPMLKLLKRDRMLIVVGNLDVIDGVDNSQLAFHRQGIAGSLIGNLADTQEVLDLCAEHGIAPEIEMIRIEDINEAYARVENGESRFRCVIDMSSLS